MRAIEIQLVLKLTVKTVYENMKLFSLACGTFEYFYGENCCLFMLLIVLIDVWTNKQTNKNKEINKENRKKSSDQTRIKPGNIQPSVSAAEQTSASFCYTWKITVDSIEKAFFCEGHIFASSHATKFCFLEVLALAWKYSILATTFCWHKLLSCERWVKIIFSTCPPSQADSSKTNVLEKVIFWKSN